MYKPNKITRSKGKFDDHKMRTEKRKILAAKFYSIHVFFCQTFCALENVKLIQASSLFFLKRKSICTLYASHEK